MVELLNSWVDTWTSGSISRLLEVLFDLVVIHYGEMSSVSV